MSKTKCVAKLMENGALVGIGDSGRGGIDPAKIHCGQRRIDLKILLSYIRPRTGVLVERDSNLSGRGDALEDDIGVVGPLEYCLIDFGLLHGVPARIGVRYSLDRKKR